MVCHDLLNRRLRDSRLGRAWIAVREDEVAAASMGVNLVRTKLWAYAIGAAFGGFAGVFLGTYNNTVNVDQFEFGFSVSSWPWSSSAAWATSGASSRRDRAVDDQPLRLAAAEQLPRSAWLRRHRRSTSASSASSCWS